MVKSHWNTKAEYRKTHKEYDQSPYYQIVRMHIVTSFFLCVLDRVA